MTRQDQLNRAENYLSEAANGMSDAIRVLKNLKENDTADKVFQQAYDVMRDAVDYLDDAISSVADGFGIGDDDD